MSDTRPVVFIAMPASTGPEALRQITEALAREAPNIRCIVIGGAIAFAVVQPGPAS